MPSRRSSVKSPSSSRDEDDDPDAATAATAKITAPAAATPPTPTLSDSIDALSEAARDAMSMIGRYAVVEPFPDAEEDDPKHASNPWKDVPAVCSDLSAARRRLETAWRTAKAAHDRERPSSPEDDEWIRDDDYDDEEESDDDDEFPKRVVAVDLDRKIDLDMTASLVNPAFRVGERDRGADDDREGDDDDDDDDRKEKDPSDDDDDAMPADEFRARYIEMMTEAFAEDLEEMSDPDGGAAVINVDILAEALASGIDLLEPGEKNRRSFFDSLRSDPAETDDDDGLTIHQRRRKELGWLADDDDNGGSGVEDDDDDDEPMMVDGDEPMSARKRM